MPRLRIDLHAEMEDGREFATVADQRDVARWEVQPFGCPMIAWDARINTAYRFLAWSALTRQQALDGMTWDQFDAACVEVSDPADPDDGDQVDVEAAGGGDDADPGRPGPSGSTSSRSRGARGKR